MDATKMLFAMSLAAALAASTGVLAQTATDSAEIERGRYLVRIGGCNDCHTPHYPERAGEIAQTEWLTGSTVGFQGPWGTTYPANLRNLMQTWSEEQWLARARMPMRPPMPWFNLRDTTDADLRAMYRFMRSLGARGDAAPAYAAPGTPVNTPYISFVPQNLPARHAAR